VGPSYLLWLACSEGGAPDLTGVWVVTHRFEDGSCPEITGGTRAMMWTVSRDSAGAYAVKVQGVDDLADLVGTSTAEGADLVGFGPRASSHTTHCRIAGSSSAVTGRAIESRTSEAFASEPGRPRACAVLWTVEATRQNG
jgi:hypothetical protein